MIEDDYDPLHALSYVEEEKAQPQQTPQHNEQEISFDCVHRVARGQQYMSNQGYSIINHGTEDLYINLAALTHRRPSASARRATSTFSISQEQYIRIDNFRLAAHRLGYARWPQGFSRLYIPNFTLHNFIVRPRTEPFSDNSTDELPAHATLELVSERRFSNELPDSLFIDIAQCLNCCLIQTMQTACVAVCAEHARGIGLQPTDANTRWAARVSSQSAREYEDYVQQHYANSIMAYESARGIWR